MKVKETYFVFILFL